jgi:hypothetical protein
LESEPELTFAEQLANTQATAATNMEERINFMAE